MNIIQTQFLALVRCGLTGEPVDSNLFAHVKVDWEGIFKLAREQALIAVVFDGVNHLDRKYFPASDLYKQWLFYSLKIERSNIYVNQILDEIVALYAHLGVYPVLLKGQGCARNYKTPLRRQCGDIDLFIGRDDYENLNIQLRKLGLLDDSTESCKHMHFGYKGVTIENHLYTMCWDKKSETEKFSKWTSDLFDSSTIELQLQTNSIKLPPVEYDILYLFLHFTNHFIDNGIGLRQICDWVLMIKAYSKQVDRADLEKQLVSLGYMRFWKVFASVVVCYLGVKAHEMPFYDSAFDKLAVKLMRRVLDEGNFGFFREVEPRKGCFFRDKFNSLYRRIKRDIQLLCFDRRMVLNHFFSFFRLAISKL